VSSAPSTRCAGRRPRGAQPLRRPGGHHARAAAFARGSLKVQSYARPGKLFTASGDLIVAEVGALTPDALRRIVDAIVALLRAGWTT